MGKKVFGIQLMPYFKSGADFGDHLDRAKGDIPRALDAWAASLRAGADDIAQVADAIRKHPEEVGEAQGDTHLASIDMEGPLARRLARAAKGTVSLNRAVY